MNKTERNSIDKLLGAQAKRLRLKCTRSNANTNHEIMLIKAMR